MQLQKSSTSGMARTGQPFHPQPLGQALAPAPHWSVLICWAHGCLRETHRFGLAVCQALCQVLYTQCLMQSSQQLLDQHRAGTREICVG